VPVRIVALSWLACSLLVPSAPARAGGAPADDTFFDWSFHAYPSDGSGGFASPVVVYQDSGTQGSRREGIQLDPIPGVEVEIYFTDGATEIWASAVSPTPPVITQGTYIGASSELSVSRVFRKDAADATLAFAIPQSELAALGSVTGDAETIRAIVGYSLEAGDFFSFAEEVQLTGNASDWTFTSGSGVLAFEIVEGDLDQAGVRFALAAPFQREIDLGAVPIGAEFAVEYRVAADALDTVQGEGTFAEAFARGKANDTDGVTLEFTGLTAMPVPEPDAALLLAAGAGVLGAVRARSRRGR
jgi:hypothetical protein